MLDPTIIRTKTARKLLMLLTKCKKYLLHKQDVDTKEADDLLYKIEKAEKIHKEEMERVGYRKYTGDE
jgi:hypothetical protein